MMGRLFDVRGALVVLAFAFLACDKSQPPAPDKPAPSGGTTATQGATGTAQVSGSSARSGRPLSGTR